jgi:hypothetical protein
MADPTHRPLEIPSLDSPQEFSGAGSHRVRDELGELIDRDLVPGGHAWP